VLTRLKDFIVALYLREPARSNAGIAAVVVAAAGAVGVVVSAPIVLGVIALIAPFIVAELTRPKVTPDAKLIDVPEGSTLLVQGPGKVSSDITV
jgi:hypothetical protein